MYVYIAALYMYMAEWGMWTSYLRIASHMGLNPGCAFEQETFCNTNCQALVDSRSGFESVSISL